MIQKTLLTALPLAMALTAHLGAAPASSAAWLPGPHPLGTLEVHLGTPKPLSLARAPGLFDSQNGLQIKPVGTGTLEYAGTRYLYTSFRVRNADKNGKAYTTAQSDLTLVAVGSWGASGAGVSSAGAGGTIAGTAVSSITRADGSDYTENPTLRKTLARAIRPTHAMALDGGRLAPIPGASDFVAFTEAEVNPANFAPPTTLEGLEASTVFPYGYAVRCVSNCALGPRTLGANPAPDQFDGAVTVAVKLPAQTNTKDNPVAFSLRLEVLGNNPARVTISPDEGLDLGPALWRAQAMGAPSILAIGSGRHTISPEQYRSLSQSPSFSAPAFQGVINVRTAEPDPKPAPGDPSSFTKTSYLLPDPQSLPTFAFPP
jgi:hypothetical protein